MKLYTVWTGTKIKGCWADKGKAVAYLAGRDASEREAWTLAEVDASGKFADEVEAAAKEKAEAKPAPGHHALKAQSIEVTSSGKILQ